MPFRSILVVDDEPVNLATLREILEPDFPLIFAASGNAALAAVAKHNPCLILLDIEMPGMNGYEVCRQLKNNPKFEAIPIIFVTSLSNSGNEEEGFAVGCVDYISKPLSPGIVRARVQTHLSLVRASLLEKSHRDAIFMIGEASHFKDNDTGVHIWRMAAYSRALAHAAGWSEPQCDLLELAAPMHDTGKLGIPDEILLKPSKLNAAEWMIMQTHSQIGFEILSKSDAPLFSLAAQVALHHHEKWDGSGYPLKLAGNDIPESARIVAIADVFDALSMNRPYKDPWPLDNIISFLNDNAGHHFDPDLIRLFMTILPEILRIKDKWEPIKEDT